MQCQYLWKNEVEPSCCVVISKSCMLRLLLFQFKKLCKGKGDLRVMLVVHRVPFISLCKVYIAVK